MSIIDQRILIAASVEYVWVYLTEPAHIPKWNSGAKQLSMLTARADGVGTRRRSVDVRGQSVVEEITAWLPPYGYKYQVIDGPYRTLNGQLRLQSVPDGTQIQWLVEYELRGAFAGLRDRLGYRRRLSGQLADSLRGLRRLIEASGVRLDREKQAKVAMQADPGFAARLARSSDPTRQTSALPMPIEAVISVGDDDLPEIPPVPVVAMPTYVATPDPTPSFVEAVPTLPPAKAKTKPLNEKRPEPLVDDTKPRPPAGLQDALTTIRPATVTGNPANPSEIPPVPASGVTTVSAALVAPRPVDPTTQTVAPMPRAVPPPPMPSLPTEPPDQPVVPQNAAAAEKTPASPDPESASPEAPQREKEKYDTGEMSIWAVFGMAPPSERNKVQLDEVIASLQPSVPSSLPPLETPPEPVNTPPPPPVEPMRAIWGQFALDQAESSGKATVLTRRMVAPKHAKKSVTVRRAD